MQSSRVISIAERRKTAMLSGKSANEELADCSGGWWTERLVRSVKGLSSLLHDSTPSDNGIRGSLVVILGGLETSDKIVAPCHDIVFFDAIHQRAPAPAPLLDTHVERTLDCIRHIFLAERIHDQRFSHLHRRARKP